MKKNQICEYFDMFTNHSFYPKITLPTRFSNTHGTLIDNFFCKLSESTIDTMFIKKFSNHQPYFTVQNDFTLNEPSVTYIKITKNDHKSVKHFINEIQTILSDIKLNLTQDHNINYNIIHDVIQYAKTSHMPQQIVMFNKYKHKKTKWITHGIIKSIQTRDNMYKKYKMTDPNSTNYYRLNTNLKT